MTQAEKYSWASLVTTAAIFWYFQMQMLHELAVVDRPPGELFELYITVIVLTIIAESVIAGVLAVSKRGSKVEKDERDRTIEAKANRNAFYFLCVAINVAIFHILADAAFPVHVLPSVNLLMHSTIFFVLFAVLFAASIVKLVSTIFYYRT